MGSAGILPAVSGILPDIIENKSRSEFFLPVDRSHVISPAGRMPAGTGWKPALPAEI
jgi:hypothetical protein